MRQRVVDPGVYVRCIKRLETVPDHAGAHPNSQRKCDYDARLKKPCETISRRYRVVLLYKRKKLFCAVAVVLFIFCDLLGCSRGSALLNGVENGPSYSVEYTCT